MEVNIRGIKFFITKEYAGIDYEHKTGILLGLIKKDQRAFISLYRNYKAIELHSYIYLYHFSKSPSLSDCDRYGRRRRREVTQTTVDDIANHYDSYGNRWKCFDRRRGHKQ